jgi:hypothetical protein
MILAHTEAGLALTGRQALARGRSPDLQAQRQHPPADVLASTASIKTDGDIHRTRRSPGGAPGQVAGGNIDRLRNLGRPLVPM